MKQTIVIAVTNDLEGDQRVHKVAITLMNNGWAPVVIGRKLRNSKPLSRRYTTRRFRLWFNRGPVFYLNYNLRLFAYLLFTHVDVITANDLDTLPASFFAAILKRKRLVYDAHEYFTGVPELVDRPAVRKIWRAIEKRLVPHVSAIMTVNESIAALYRAQYSHRITVIRNLPLINQPPGIPGHLPEEFTRHPFLLYQGAVNMGRGLEQLLDAMTLMPGIYLVIVGDGDIKGELMHQAKQLNLSTRVCFTGRVSFENLAWYTRQATLGISLEQDIGLNYHYALPNKLFDYMHAGLPVIASDLPEIRKVVATVEFGVLIREFSPEFLAETISGILNNKELLATWSKNALREAPNYSWEQESDKLLKLYREL